MSALCRMELDTAPFDGWEELLARHPGVVAQLLAVHESGIPEYRYTGSHGALVALLCDPEGWAGLSSAEMLSLIEPIPGEARIVGRSNAAVCSSSGEVQWLSAPEAAVQVRCPRGHWTWEDGNYCGACGVKLR